MNIEKFGLYKNSIAGGYPAKKASNASKTSGSSFTEKLSKASKMDTIEISSNTFESQTPLSDIKNDIISSINEPSNEDRVAQVKQQLAAGTYNMNTSEFAGLLLSIR